MDSLLVLIPVLATVSFGVTTVLLWYFGKTQMTRLSLFASLAPERRLSRSPIRSSSRLVDKLVALGGARFGFDEPPEKEKPNKKLKVAYSGEAALPRKVYEDNSRNISINLKRTFSIPDEDSDPLQIQDIRSGKSIVLKILQDSSLEQFLEIELLAAGLTVGGDKKQRQNLTLDTLSYHWNLYFPNSGNHEITLILRVVSPDGTIGLGNLDHTIRVVKLDNLTRRQYLLLTSLAAVLTGGFGLKLLGGLPGVFNKLTGVLSRLGVW